jgi:hypothetical protein
MTIDVYVKARAGDGGDLLSVATSEKGVAFTVAKGEREILSLVVPWGEYWQLLRNLNACEKAFFAAEQDTEED